MGKTVAAETAGYVVRREMDGSYLQIFGLEPRFGTRWVDDPAYAYRFPKKQAADDAAKNLTPANRECVVIRLVLEAGV